MPIYNFRCSGCDNTDSEMMSIPIFKKRKENPEKCTECESGKMQTSLAPIKGNIERKKEDLLPELQEEANEIVRKVLDGDYQTIIDVFGDTKNPYLND